MARIDKFIDTGARAWADIVSEDVKAGMKKLYRGKFRCTKKLSKWLGVPEGLELTLQQAYSVHQLVCRYEQAHGSHLTDNVAAG